MIETRAIVDRDQWLAWRRADVTASAAAALLGAHPYLTAYALWAEKTGKIAPRDATPAMERGLELEPLARKWLARDHPDWTVRDPQVYLRDPDYRLGCTPDVFAVDRRREGLGVIQIKSVEPTTFRRAWHNDAGVLEPPLYAVIQAIVEADLTGASWAAVAALVISYGIDLYLVDVPLHPTLMTRVRSEVRDFWRLIDEGQRPAIDWKEDAKLVAELYEPAGDEILDMSTNNELPKLADERVALRGEKTRIEERLDEIRARILDKLEGAGAARLADGRLITAKRVKRAAYTVNASSFIDLRIKNAPTRKAHA